MSYIIPSTSEKELTTLIDSSSGATYIGSAKLGTTTSSAGWQIQKITKNGSLTTIQYANSSKRFNQVWDDRASLTYSN